MTSKVNKRKINRDKTNCFLNRPKYQIVKWMEKRKKLVQFYDNFCYNFLKYAVVHTFSFHLKKNLSLFFHSPSRNRSTGRRCKKQAAVFLMLRPLIIASSSIQSLKMINCNFFKKSVSLEKWYVYQVDHVYAEV